VETCVIKMNQELVDFCKYDLALCSLKHEKHKQCRDASHAKDSASRVISSLIEAYPNKEICVNGSDGYYMIKVREKKPSQNITCTSAIARLKGILGKGAGDFIKLLHEQNTTDTLACIHSAIMSTAFPENTSKVEYLDIQPLKQHDEDSFVEDVEISKLLETYIKNRDDLVRISKEFSDQMSIISKAHRESEKKLVGQLSGSSVVQKVTLRSENNKDDNFYVRVKPPRKPIKRKVPRNFFDKTVKRAIAESVSSIMKLEDAAELMTSPENMQELCTRVSDKLKAKELTESSSEQRITLDRVRSRACAENTVTIDHT
jgi:hypothetical protein